MEIPAAVKQILEERIYPQTCCTLSPPSLLSTLILSRDKSRRRQLTFGAFRSTYHTCGPRIFSLRFAMAESGLHFVDIVSRAKNKNRKADAVCDI
ncbi:hypothetical protein PoB_001028600 [Plakobranchus ocellatus]|uniref:Uncharacterized protein n=1 Tax=Plakobranchus ocellatus TaxID=259542 RepID=A0AAV3Y947_9GAST|nr:hypothetical protein PoB_001028600 [Plakobranchus ocellatus]